MDLTGLVASIKLLDLDTETTLANQIQLATSISNKIEQFNNSNESKFHFASQIDQTLGRALLKYLTRCMSYLNCIEKNQTPESYKLSDVYYSLACHCLDAIRIVSRDTDVISTFHVNELLDQIQQIADLKGLVIKKESEAKEITDTNFDQKESLTLEEAQIVLKTRERSLLILTALKSMSNLIYNSKSVQDFYANNKLGENISIYLTNLLRMENKIYLNSSEYNIVMFKLKILFLMTVFVKEIRSRVSDHFQIFITFDDLVSRLDLSEATDCVLVCEVLKISYNLTMDIESVRSHARDILKSVKLTGEKTDLNIQNGSVLHSEDETTLKRIGFTLNKLLEQCSLSDEKLTVNPIKKAELVSNIINLLTNLPSVCFNALIREISIETNHKYENKEIKSLKTIREFLENNLSLYINKKISADILYPVLMLCSVMSKSNKSIRYYYRAKILPPLTKKDLVNLPENGNTIKNYLVKIMTDPNLQLKRMSAQFLFILCKENVGRLIKFTGYGNAAGLLAEAGLMLSTHGDKSAYSSESGDSDSEDYKKLESGINPITGQAEIECDTELMNEKEREVNQKKRLRKDIFEGMTEEQKEYEAVQLANAIDKLTRLGSGLIKPATIGPDGRPVEIEHVLQLQEKNDS